MAFAGRGMRGAQNPLLVIPSLAVLADVGIYFFPKSGLLLFGLKGRLSRLK